MRGGNLDEELAAMNERFAVIGNFHGKCVVVDLQPPVVTSLRTTPQSSAAFCKRFANREVLIASYPDGRDTFAPLGTWWLAHKQRRQYDGIVFGTIDAGWIPPEIFNLAGIEGFTEDNIPKGVRVLSE